MNKINILGFGGHARVIIDLAKMNCYDDFLIFDDNIKFHGFCENQVKIIGSIDRVESGQSVIAIGQNKVRYELFLRLNQLEWVILKHPFSYISEDVEIGEGSVIMAGAIIQPGVKIGKHCIINTGAIIDHDCVIADFVHIAPKVALAGGVRVGEGTFIGIGSSIVPYVSIGDWVTIGAGSAIINNIPNCTMAAGVPAVVKKKYI